MNTEVTLTPAQQQALDRLLETIETCAAVVLKSEPGMGRTTVLRHAHATAGGVFLGLRQYAAELMQRAPQAIEESFLAWIEAAMEGQDRVFIDDLHLITAVSDAYDYPRSHLLEAILTALLDTAEAQGKTLVFGCGADCAPDPLSRRGNFAKIEDFTAADYECLCRVYLDSDQAGSMNYSKVHRFAPRLTAWQLENACRALRRKGEVDTEGFIDYLTSLGIKSNVKLKEVRQVDWKDLKGIDDVIEALEAKIALPLENHELATELRLKPRRGVLLAGPPGTGKTTIGRALAHRLKGKFFLIDGTVVAGAKNFYERIDHVFASAIKNAPSVIFIDDTDLIFENKDDTGFYRYLLTKLDGLESASAERVCVMMTAMDVSSLPAALVRSGRVELWLQTRMPDRDARASILVESLAKLPAPFASADVDMLASASHGMTGADINAMVEDGKLLLAHDKARGKELRGVEAYFLEAIDTVRSNRRSYARRKPTQTEEVRIGFTVGPDTK